MFACKVLGRVLWGALITVTSVCIAMLGAVLYLSWAVLRG